MLGPRLARHVLNRVPLAGPGVLSFGQKRVKRLILNSSPPSSRSYANSESFSRLLVSLYDMGFRVSLHLRPSAVLPRSDAAGAEAENLVRVPFLLPLGEGGSALPHY